MLEEITGILFNIKEVMENLVPESPTAQYKGVDNCMSDALESSIKLIVRKKEMVTTANY